MTFAGRTLLTICILASAAKADTITLDPTGRGLSSETAGYAGDAGNYDTAGNYYSAGGFGATVARDYFNFTIPVGDWISASLYLDEPAGGHGGDATTFNVYSLFGNPSDTSVAYSFSSLGSGTLYGTVSLSASDNGTTIDIELNSAALADIRSYAGGANTFNIAGVDSGENTNSFDFGNTGGASSVLVLSSDSAAPEPGSIALMGLGLVSLAAARFRRNGRS